VTPLPSPSYGVPPGVGGTAPLSSGGTVRSVYRGSDGVPPKKKAALQAPHQSSTR
jgi:hypothetical protein